MSNSSATNNEPVSFTVDSNRPSIVAQSSSVPNSGSITYKPFQLNTEVIQKNHSIYNGFLRITLPDHIVITNEVELVFKNMLNLIVSYSNAITCTIESVLLTGYNDIRNFRIEFKFSTYDMKKYPMLISAHNGVLVMENELVNILVK